MIEDNEILLALKKVEKGISFSSPSSIDKYIEYAEKHDLVFRHFPLFDCGFIIFNDTTIILRSEKEDITTLSNKAILVQ